MILIFKIIAIGIGATLLVDCWSLIQKLFKIKSLDYRYLGRWILNFSKRKYFHRNIMITEQVRGELLVGWVSHYLIGITFSFLLILIYGIQWLQEPSIYPALVIGIVTLIAPLFIMQPAFGFGIASSNLSNPNIRRLKSLLTHIVYGAGMYVTALLVNQL